MKSVSSPYSHFTLQILLLLQAPRIATRAAGVDTPIILAIALNPGYGAAVSHFCKDMDDEYRFGVSYWRIQYANNLPGKCQPRARTHV